MPARIVYVTRLTRLPLIGADGGVVARVVDVVIGVGSRPPRVIGFVAAVQRRHVFVGVGRVGEVDAFGVRLRRGSINMRQFEVRDGERLVVRELIGRRVRGQRVVDVGLTASPEPFAWEVATVALATHRMPGLRHAPEVLDWNRPGPRQDLYAVGMVGWRMLTGAGDPEPRQRIGARPAGVLPMLWTVLSHLCDPDPARRFKDADAARRALAPHRTDLRFPALTLDGEPLQIFDHLGPPPAHPR